MFGKRFKEIMLDLFIFILSLVLGVVVSIVTDQEKIHNLGELLKKLL